MALLSSVNAAVISTEITLGSRSGGFGGGPHADDCGLGGLLTAGAAGTQGIFELYSTNGGGCVDLKAGYGSLGANHRWFTISPGAEISPTTVSGYANLLGTDTQVSAALNAAFYLGVWTDTNLSTTPSVGDHFGWVQVINEPTGLSIIAQGTETTGAGIYAGTLTAVPETTSTMLLASGLVLVPLARRRTVKRA